MPVHRRFQQWCEREVLLDILTQFANTLHEEGAIDEREGFIDATFASAKGGGDGIGLGQDHRPSGTCRPLRAEPCCAWVGLPVLLLFTMGLISPA